MSSHRTLNVVVSGAAGQIGYALSFRIANGDLLHGQKLHLNLLEIPQAMGALEGVCMELQDCGFPSLAGVTGTDDPNVAFKDADIVFLVGSFPRKAGMDRSDLLGKNGGIFKIQGEALSAHAHKDVKVIVVGNPANTNAAICLHYAKNLKPENFCSMSRLDHNRMLGEVAARLNLTPGDIHRPIIWGNHSNTMVPDLTHAQAQTAKGVESVCDLIPKDVREGEFLEKIATRGGAVIKARGASSAASAAHAALCCVHDWIWGTRYGEWVSMSVLMKEGNPYGITPGIFYSHPVTIDDQSNVRIVEGLEVTPFMRDKIKASEEELVHEKNLAWKALGLE